MLQELWYAFLYQPLFNALIYIYNNIADQNLGWAVVWLTVFLRILLLPLTIIAERNNSLHEKVEIEALETAQALRHDPVMQKQEFRRIMKKHRISPWAKVLALVVQVVVFLLLYQVFVQGINGEKVLKTLYQFVDFPGRINIDFYGFDIGKTHDLIWPGIVGVYVFVGILLQNRRRAKWEQSDMFFTIFFPLFIFGFLWYLPMVKSLFLLTTMVFSDIIGLLARMVTGKKKDPHGHDDGGTHH